MAASSKSYKLWFRRPTDAAWVQATQHVSLRFRDAANFITSLDGVSVYTRDATLQAILASAKPYWRVTKLDSTTGNNGTLIATGIVSEATADDQSAPSGGNPTLYSVTGLGFADVVQQYTYDTETTFSATRQSVINSIIAQVNTTAGATVIAAGTLDVGPSLNVRVRKDHVFAFLTQLAAVGDAVNLFTAFVEIATAAGGGFTLIPQVNVYDANNARYRTSDPFAAMDGRVLITNTDCRPPVKVVPERDRIRNAVKIRYAGYGSGAAQAEYGFVSDATSISDFGRREAVIQAPWIQDSATAQLYANTVLGMFKGVAGVGIQRAEVVLKSGELFSSTFNARIGDVVGIKRPDGTQVMSGRMLGYSYDQDTESLTIYLGLPKVPLQELRAQAGQVAANFTSMKVTTSGGQLFEPAVSHDHTVLGGGSIADNAESFQVVGSGSIVNTTTFLAAESLEVQVEVDVTAIADGPLNVQVFSALDFDLVLGSGTYLILERIFDYTFVNLRPGTVNEYGIGQSVSSGGGSVGTRTPPINKVRLPYNFGPAQTNPSPSTPLIFIILVKNLSGQTVNFTANGIRLRIWDKAQHQHNF